MAVNLHTNHYRFGIDELAESTHGWYAAEDANPTPGQIPLDTVFLLRFNVQETGGTAANNTDNTFEFRINGGAWTALTTTSVGPRAVAATALTNGGNCTKRLSGTGTFEASGAGQTEDGTSGGAANDIAASGCSETECGLIIDSADVSPGDVIEFRITSPDFTVTNDVVPTLNLPVSITPPVGSLSLAGVAAALAFLLIPSAGGLTLAGAAPTVQESAGGEVITPPAGTLALAGTAPTVVVETRLIPAAGSLAGTGAAPSVSIDFRLAPSPAALVASGTLPAVTEDVRLTPGAGIATLAGAAPTLTTDNRLQPPAGQLTLAGTVPTVRTESRIAPDSGAISLAGSPPVWNLQLIPLGGGLTLAGAAPQVQESGGGATNITPPTGTLSVVGALPVQALGLAPGSGTLTGVGAVAPIAAGIPVGAGALTLTGIAPSVTGGANVMLTPGAGIVTLAGVPPDVLAGAVLGRLLITDAGDGTPIRSTADATIRGTASQMPVRTSGLP